MEIFPPLLKQIGAKGSMICSQQAGLADETLSLIEQVRVAGGFGSQAFELTYRRGNFCYMHLLYSGLRVNGRGIERRE